MMLGAGQQLFFPGGCPVRDKLLDSNLASTRYQEYPLIVTTRNASDPYQASPGAKPALEPTTSGIQICHPDFAVAWTVYPLRQAELHWTPSSHRWGGNHGGRWARRRQPWKAVSAISQLWEPLYLVPWARMWRWPAGCGGGVTGKWAGVLQHVSQGNPPPTCFHLEDVCRTLCSRVLSLLGSPSGEQDLFIRKCIC